MVREKKRSDHIICSHIQIQFVFFCPFKMYKWINCVIHGEKCCGGMRAMKIAMSEFIVICI